jgi:DNA segregation ATPase FtsK/SpoIIIE-like protein
VLAGAAEGTVVRLVVSPSTGRRGVVVIDAAPDGGGAPRSGRSQLLRTIAASLACCRGCADVHLYGLDCGNGALLPVADLPHCGAVVTRTQAERAARLMARLGAELAAHISGHVRTGRALLNTGDGHLTTVTIPAG